MVLLDQVYFSYQGQQLYQGLDLSFQQGQIIGLLGKNGSGKSSLLNLVAGLNFAQKGQVTTLGCDAKQRSTEMLTQIFFLPEQFQLPNLSGKEYQKLYSPFYPLFDSEAFQSYADTFEVNLKRKLSKLSMGQQKKFLIAFGLAANCRLNLLDEPTNGLDIPSKSLFRKLIAEAADEHEKTFVISTHQVKDIEKLIDQVCLVDEGKLLLDASIETLSQQLIMTTTDQLQGDELFTQEIGLGQYAVVKSNTSGDNSMIDLELLFNAVLENPNLLTDSAPSQEGVA